MHAKIDRADCMFLISNERLRRFQELIEELDFFTFILPFVKDSYQRSATILDIWYLISTKEISRIENPENTMIYPYRWYYLKIVESFQIKRYIQLALYDNDRLAFICAVHMYKELDEFITNKMAVNEEVENNYKILQQYNGKSIRPYYDIKYIELENYPKQLAYLQNMLVSELQKIHREYEKPLTWIMAKAIDEASSLYEAVFGLINDWGGRVP